MTISERIFSLLEAQNKKQADLARALGVRQNTVTNWKKSNYKPNIDLKMIDKVIADTEEIKHIYEEEN